MMVKYYYDELNQLIRENNKEQNKTITYEYDGGGNLLNKKNMTIQNKKLQYNLQRSLNIYIIMQIGKIS